MNDDSITRIEMLERRVAILSQSLRIMVGVVIGAYAVRALVVMLGVPQYKAVFADLFGGQGLPPYTTFVLTYSTAIFSTVLVLSMVALLTLVFRSDRAWAIPFSVGLLVICITITESAWHALMPIFSMVNSLGH